MLIRIDRATFRRNPRAGATSTTLATGLSETHGTYDDDSGHYELRGCEQGLLVDSARCHSAPAFNVGEIYEPSAFDGSRLRIETHRDVQTFSHQPEPDWLFSYEPTPVTCNECGATFPNQRLTSDCAATGDDEACSFAVCPECNAWECCDVEYEQPEDVARELGLHD